MPRCYLKRFSYNEKCIHTYDKLPCRQYNASMMTVCCDDDIYTMSDEYGEAWPMMKGIWYFLMERNRRGK